MDLSLICGLTVSTPLPLLCPLLFCARPSDDLLANSKIWPNSQSVISQSTISLIAGLVPSRNAKSRISQPRGGDPGRESEGNKQKELVSSVGTGKVLIKTPLPSGISTPNTFNCCSDEGGAKIPTTVHEKFE